jgi:hypothetical protein
MSLVFKKTIRSLYLANLALPGAKLQHQAHGTDQ